MKLNLPEKLVTERLLFQRLRYEDAEEIFYTYASKPEATKFVSWPTHNLVSDTRTFIDFARNAWSEGTDYTWTIRLRENNKLIGSFGMINEEGKVQFGYILSPTYWGRGYATEACLQMMTLLRAEPNVHRVGTFADVSNAASIAVLRKCGLVEEATLEKWMRFVNQNNEVRDCIFFRLPL